jgi:hypothetical protein
MALLGGGDDGMGVQLSMCASVSSHVPAPLEIGARNTRFEKHDI